MAPERYFDHLLIGGGIASATCARTLREEGATGSIALVGRELDAPYHRPPISKDYLRGASSREDGLVLADDWWAQNDVELLKRTSVTALDTAAGAVTLSTKQEIGFGQALLATGAMVRRLDVDGGALEGVHYLRTPANADALRLDIEDAESVVLIGGSYIGCEVAASLTELGKRATIVMQEAVTFQRGFGPRVGEALQGVLEAHGIEVVAGEEVSRLEGGDPHGEAEARVRVVHTISGRTLEADAVVAGVGALPDVALARRAGLQIGERGGVLTDERLCTSVAGVFAAGDMCEYASSIHGRAMRIEHEEVAAAQGETVAHNMLGHERCHDVVPYFFSDLSDWVSLQYVGPAERWEQEIVRGSLEDLDATVFYVDDGRVAAALTVGRSEDLNHARRLIADRASVADRLDALADAGQDLRAIA